MKILMERTDETHSITMTEIIDALAEYNISAERKSIYNDIECLRLYGMDIIGSQEDRTYYYHVGNRQFELAELKLLVDSVQSSKFITRKKSEELIKKIEKLASVHEAKSLQRQVYVTNRIKTDNESVYYIIDDIHNAIQNNNKIKFQYMDYSITKELKPRRNGQWYEVSPAALIWEDERYYLVGYSSLDKEIRHYRVDKIGKISVLDEKREGLGEENYLDVADYAKKVFGMYGGEPEGVTIGFPEKLIGVFVDRFGKEIDIFKREEGYLSVRVSVVLSGQFYGWLTGLGSGVKIISPSKVKDEYCAYLEEVLNNNR